MGSLDCYFRNDSDKAEVQSSLMNVAFPNSFAISLKVQATAASHYARHKHTVTAGSRESALNSSEMP